MEVGGGCCGGEGGEGEGGVEVEGADRGERDVGGVRGEIGGWRGRPAVAFRGRDGRKQFLVVDLQMSRKSLVHQQTSKQTKSNSLTII